MGTKEERTTRDLDFVCLLRSVLSPLLFYIVVDVVTENAKKGFLKEVLYANDLVLINKMLEGLKERFFKMEKCIGEQGSEGES